MFSAIKKHRDKRSEGDEGFTLIELLVVIIIIGLLAAIAIPVFLNQRKKAWNAAMQVGPEERASRRRGVLLPPSRRYGTAAELADRRSASRQVTVSVRGTRLRADAPDRNSFCMEADARVDDDA